MRKSESSGIDPKKLAGMFTSEAEKILSKKLMAFVGGSVAKGKYEAGKSDIDLIILARDGYLDANDYLKILELRKVYGEKYGTVWKVGRQTSIIDTVIIFSAEAQEKLKNVFGR